MINVVNSISHEIKDKFPNYLSEILKKNNRKIHVKSCLSDNSDGLNTVLYEVFCFYQ